MTRPHEGGVKIVFDVAVKDAAAVAALIARGAFDVRPYYPAGSEPGWGGAAAGYVRYGAERECVDFSEAERAQIEAAFAAITANVPLRVIGADTWTASRGDGPAGVREPRRPKPRDGAGVGV